MGCALLWLRSHGQFPDLPHQAGGILGDLTGRGLIALFGELGGEIVAVTRRNLLARHHCDAFAAQLGVQLGPDALLVGNQPARGFIDLGKLLGGRHAVGTGGGDTGAHHAHQAGDAHHVELVEIGRGDGQKAQPLEQGMAAVQRLFNDAAVEGQPGQFAVDEPLRRGRIERERLVMLERHHILGRNLGRAGGILIGDGEAGGGAGGHGPNLSRNP